ncbi:MAG: hypothetical protein HC908_01285 [Calothrix sp. SM1_7_51]|nr:hypothetical protein [Calothrix sp. SM1_7_51]
MDTKLKGDIAEQATILHALKRAWGVLKPVGDRLAYIEVFDLFYIFPVDVFVSYGSEIHLVEDVKRQRKPRSAEYRDAWRIIGQAAVSKEKCVNY